MQGTLCTVLEILRSNEFNFNHKNLHNVRATACKNICIKSPRWVSCKLSLRKHFEILLFYFFQIISIYIDKVVTYFKKNILPLLFFLLINIQSFILITDAIALEAILLNTYVEVEMDCKLKSQRCRWNPPKTCRTNLCC